MEKKLFKLINSIENTDETTKEKCRQKIDSLLKPPGSLGSIEDIAVELSGIFGYIPKELGKKCILIFASDNGVVNEGIASAPMEFTKAMTLRFADMVTGVGVFAKKHGCDLIVTDVGIASDINSENVINRKIAYGTNNFFEKPAMSREDAVKAILVGAEITEKAIKKGYDIFGVGEMGIGNTSSSAAVLSCLTGALPEECVGKGAGLDKNSYNKKKEIIEKAIIKNNVSLNDPIDILSKVGGFDIAAMCGAFLCCAALKKPVVADGFISIVSLLLASKLNKKVLEYAFLSHISDEPGYLIAMKEIKKDAYFNLKMRLGEGSGCPFTFDLMEYSLAMLNDMAEFKDIEESKEYVQKINLFEF